MAEWTPEAQKAMQDYLDQVANLCNKKGDDAAEVIPDLRDHIMLEAEKTPGGNVTVAHIQILLSQLGTPEQVTGVTLVAKDPSIWGLVDGMLRDRTLLYARLFSNQKLKKLCGSLTLIFVLSTGFYGLAMGSFRWVHPQFFFSDYELSLPGQKLLRGQVMGVDAEEHVVYVAESYLPVKSSLGATIRFNVTDPSEPYAVKSMSIEKGFGRIVLAANVPLAESQAWRLPLFVALKAPALFLLTLLLCLPALYVLNLTFGLNLNLGPTITLMLFALAGTGVMLAVFVPIVALFSVVTSSYHFTKLMHVLVFAISGGFGVKVLWEGLSNMAQHPNVKIKSLLVTWLMLYCLVGGQVSWSLKPWVGTPYLPATPPFRVDRGNIYVSTFQSLRQMFRSPNAGVRPVNGKR